MTGLYDHKSSYIQGSLRSFVCGESGREQLHNHKPSYEGEWVQWERSAQCCNWTAQRLALSRP